jgi:hypothetical protein
VPLPGCHQRRQRGAATAAWTSGGRFWLIFHFSLQPAARDFDADNCLQHRFDAGGRRARRFVAR